MSLRLTLALTFLLLSACIKAPDDGMALGDATTADKVDQVLADAQSGVPETQAFHVGDTGVIEYVETIYSSSSLKESDVYKLTSIDPDYFYFDDYKVKADTTTKYKMARNHGAANAPTPTPAATPTASSSSAFLNLIDFIKDKVRLLAAKITIQTSTAVGEVLHPSRQRKMDSLDLQIQRDVINHVRAADTGSVETTTQNPSDSDDTSSGGTSQYYGLKFYKHSYQTNNCSQIKDCKVTATHIEFNEINANSGKATQVHWTYEVSKEVPGLFVVMSKCGSALTIVNNVQIPFMDCWTLDTFHFGAGTTPPQE